MRLVTLEEDGETVRGYCCLGIAAELAGETFTVRDDDDFAPKVREYGTEEDGLSTTALTPGVMAWLGVTSHDLHTSTDQSAMGMNDMGESFASIAERFRKEGFLRSELLKED
jgi:hypothetical protein